MSATSPATYESTSQLVLRPISQTPINSISSPAIPLISPDSKPRIGGSNQAAVAAGSVIGGLLVLGITGLVLLEVFMRKRALWRRSPWFGSDTITTAVSGPYGESSEGTTAVASQAGTEMKRLSLASGSSGGGGESYARPGSLNQRGSILSI
ncbi:hypothetical protein BD324DRAFT_650530 [Kockovaella imperatae]|uniref:Uncharacterized protein n=1 Tax=Kockovaella imperatae TaxID=4999 RepID=A0A1Y1UIV6_9TREE|nr:hypothetical protein BD324DRAFT_650530 [Kockovaella imperatae]ORX37990.1 hypothetical protein BD324DRAFT_650530 [Kockovaella imperatae]